MESLIAIINTFGNFFSDIISPTSCLSCEHRGEIFCDKCMSQIRTTERKTENNIMSLYDYRDEMIRKAIWDFKYHKKWLIGKKFGKLLYENFIEEISELEEYTKGQKIIVIPVPISKNRNKNRGYNQSEKIAQGFCKCNPKIFKLRKDIIIKTKDTLPQAKISDRKKRLKNMVGVFNIKNKEKIKNRTIIIIDDVTTTGATIGEIIKILQKNKAKKILGLTVAH